MERLNINQIVYTSIAIDKNNNNLELKKSISKYGQLRPIILNTKDEIIDGHKIYKILKDLNIQEVWVKRIRIVNKEQLYCELNLIKSDIDPVKFFRYVKDYIDIQDNCLPFTKKDLEGFIKLLDFDWNFFKKNTQVSLF